MPNLIAPDDPHLHWAGAVSVEAGDGWVMPWRLPHEDRGLYADELIVRASHPSGVRLVFRSDTSSIEVLCKPVTERTPVELVVDGQVVGSAETADRSEFRFHALGNDSKLIELWLPLFGEFRLRGIVLDEGASLTSCHPELVSGSRVAGSEPASPRWITYGSSITQCRTAHLPTLSWPARVARARGYDLTSLGHGGQCHLDPMVARVIRDSDADLISLCPFMSS